jgi:formate hydrogenlyase subunit 3/multisubunit Na+/H+ antiporter MnhD subunit
MNLIDLIFRADVVATLISVSAITMWFSFTIFSEQSQLNTRRNKTYCAISGACLASINWGDKLACKRVYCI